MSTTALTGLLEYLYDTLTPSNLRWVGEQLINEANQQEHPMERYTMEEILDMVEKGRQQIDQGEWISHEDFMREWEEEIQREEQALAHKEEPVMAMAV